ncbi:uncharacterized protein G2W53_028422 [Senna tora]|uniref:Uncharacterized protein n=1 Tax=Senna tora TaxID=362788 RepID=A0A834T3C5_9FABA|nr:uncharacterized protein G2W53_028321 [Senna tora]KAF7814453.1 uncharacterized protein G2W53_028422 [Senna tora]
METSVYAPETSGITEGVKE